MEMSLRTRSAAAAPGPVASGDSSSSNSVDDHHEMEPESPKSGEGARLLQKPQSTSQTTALSQTLAGTANLANLLPTGTLLAFQLLTPVFTNNGSCDAAMRPMTAILLVVLGVSCFLECFTDSVRTSNGKVYHGFATLKGIYLFDAEATASLPDLRKYRLTFIDWVHAVLSVQVFGAVALRDRNVVSCLYPTPGHEAQEVLDIVPIGVGLICSLLFMVFPTRRHGIGYPVTSGK